MQARYRLLVMSLVLTLMLHAAGCATTDIESFVDPDFRSATFHRILVSPSYDDLQMRATLERQMVAALKARGCDAVGALDVFAPTREFTDEQLYDKLTAGGFDAVMHIDLTDAYVEEQYIPEQTIVRNEGFLTANTLFGRRRPGGFSRFQETTFVTTTGGYIVRSPRMRHRITLYDAGSRRLAWMATTFTAGDADTPFKRLAGSLAESVAGRLKIDGLIGGSGGSPAARLEKSPAPGSEPNATAAE